MICLSSKNLYKQLYKNTTKKTLIQLIFSQINVKYVIFVMEEHKIDFYLKTIFVKIFLEYNGKFFFRFTKNEKHTANLIIRTTHAITSSYFLDMFPNFFFIKKRSLLEKQFFSILKTINGIGEKKARKIINCFPSFRTLFKIFSSINTINKKKKLLNNYLWEFDSYNKIKYFDLNISKKICNIFHNYITGEELIS